ncbi:MAG TPA: class I SAM-dependent methyltransferase [Cytophagaceae bacterium]|jgi:cyclopropane-fatty-acyl-phospholipid synthase|nr:class I SAM-dependent methyltransferase [Cytophagaceae bacterium]
MWYTGLLEKNLVPDFLIRKGIRDLLKQRLADEISDDLEGQQKHFMDLLKSFKSSAIAVETQAANEQHYEVPTEFYLHTLGKNLKYSSGYWKNDNTTFDQSEDDMLELTCQRAELKNGMEILELGCGWGSLTLFMAAKFPQSNILAVSNSATQRTHIEKVASQRGLNNVKIVTADINVFTTERRFDRIVSVEMFEHMRNHAQLFEKISGFLKDEAKMFIHIFTHKELTYLFEVKDETDWMSKYFFTGGMMPSDHYLLYFQDHFTIQNHWRVNGMHYSKTSEAWLSKMDHNKAIIMPLFEKTYSKEQALKWWVYWRIFFMSCAELWGYDNGNEWFVSHYLFQKR